jgi:hypothetical protein
MAKTADVELPRLGRVAVTYAVTSWLEKAINCYFAIIYRDCVGDPGHQ